MDRMFDLNELAVMTGFTTRTLRSYLKQGLLHGEKVGEKWQFSTESLARFFEEPYVKEGLRIKRTGLVFDFLASRSTVAGKACVVLDLPGSAADAAKLSAFFCKQMEAAANTVFTFDQDNGISRVILSGNADEVGRIMAAYNSWL